MVKKEKIVNKEGVAYTTKVKGENLYEYTFQENDEFIPEFNTYSVKKADPSKNQLYDTITLKCKVQGFQNEEPIFVKLTDGQKKMFDNRVKEGIEPNQHKWIVKEYDLKTKKYLGLYIKKLYKKPKNFDDFMELEE